MKYVLSYTDPENHFIDFSLTINGHSFDEIAVQLPAWRPGRYELGNFAKNIKDFEVHDMDDNPISFKKLTKDKWCIQSNGKDFKITYRYYASELNAGSTYLDENQLYVNPVNCFLFLPEFPETEIEITLDVPESYQVYSAIAKESSRHFKAINYHELFDSPFIASPSVQHRHIPIKGIQFHFCFQGEIKLNWEKLILDFTAFIEYQIDLFGGFPHQTYHFLFQITSHNAYHGVEHHDSTVILLGPSYDVFDRLYTELLGVSSHELYHVWNVKGIRPIDMVPYDYTRENYTELGYVTEGVTTYMGDRILFESNVFDQNQYFKELSNLLRRHFHNDGRLHYSVSESSWDTWLDGYTPGIPGRKVSIYVEGALIAFICDAEIRNQTKGLKSLHDVMKVLHDSSKKVSSYDATTYKDALESVSGTDFTNLFDALIYGVQDFSPYLQRAFAVFGWKYSAIKSDNAPWLYGFKTQLKNNEVHVISVLENSSAFESGLTENDHIISINGIKVSQNLNKWLSYFNSTPIELSIFRNQKLKTITLLAPNTHQFYNYKIEKI